MEMFKNWNVNYVWLTFHVLAYNFSALTLQKEVFFKKKKKITAWLTCKASSQCSLHQLAGLCILLYNHKGAQ